MALSVLATSLAVTTLWLTVSSELTTPGGASPVGDKAEEGFVPDPATLVLGCEGLRGRCSGNDPRPRSEDPRESLQRGWRESSTKKMSRPQSSGMRASTKKKYCGRSSPSK